MKNTKEVPAEQKKNVLENGTHSVYGPDFGTIEFDTFELHSGSGEKNNL